MTEKQGQMEGFEKAFPDGKYFKNRAQVWAQKRAQPVPRSVPNVTDPLQMGLHGVNCGVVRYDP